MATQTLITGPTQLQVVQLDRAQLASELTRVLGVGAVFRLAVEQNLPGGKGLLSLGGQLFPATLPSNLAAGDRFVGQVVEWGDSVVFKVLDLQRESRPTPTSPTTQLTLQLENLLKPRGSTPLETLQPFVLKDPLTSGLKIPLSLSSPDELSTPAQVLRSLLASSNGNVAQSFAEATTELRTMLQPFLPTVEERLFAALFGRLGDLVEGNEGETMLRVSLTKLGDILEQAIKNTKLANEEPAKVVRDALRTLGQDTRSTAELKQEIRTLLGTIEEKLQSSSQSQRFDLPQLERLEYLVDKLDAATNLHRALNQLNPLMQAVNEPALILLPFLFEGLLYHGEIAVDPQPKRKKREQPDEPSSRGKRKAKPGPFQRVQVNVPLGTMGAVHVDIAHRSEEMLVNFVVMDEEVADFLASAVEELGTILRSYGFTELSIQTHVGKPEDVTPEWIASLGARAAVVA